MSFTFFRIFQTAITSLFTGSLEGRFFSYLFLHIMVLTLSPPGITFSPDSAPFFPSIGSLLNLLPPLPLSAL